MFEFLDVLDKLDTIPAEFHSFYKSGDDGKFTFDKENTLAVAVAKTVNGMGGALKGARKEANEYKGKMGDLKLFAEYGDNMTDIHKNVFGKIKTLEETLASKKDVDVEKIKDGITQSMKGEITKRDERITSMSEALHSHLVQGQAASALAKFKGNVELAMPHIQRHLKVVEEGGKFSVRVVDEKGEVRYGGDVTSAGQFMGVEEFVKEMSTSDKYAPLFASDKGNGGGGADPNGQRRQQQQQSGGKTALQKIAAGVAQLS